MSSRHYETPRWYNLWGAAVPIQWTAEQHANTTRNKCSLLKRMQRKILLLLQLTDEKTTLMTKMIMAPTSNLQVTYKY